MVPGAVRESPLVIAYHEAGHAVARIAWRHQVTSITLDPPLRRCRIPLSPDPLLPTRSQRSPVAAEAWGGIRVLRESPN